MMPTTDEDGRAPIETSLRAALEPDAETLERVVRAALAPRLERGRRAWLYAAAIAASLAVALLVARLGGPPEPQAGPPTALVSVGSLVLLQVPGREAWIANAAPARPERADTSKLLIVWKETVP